MRLATALLTAALLSATASLALAQDKGTVNPKPLPPLANPDDPKNPAKELFGRKAERRQHAGALDRLLHPRLSRRRRRAADQRQDLAGDAAVAQPQLGASGSRRLHGAARGKSAEGVELAGAAGRRHGAAARRADAHRPRQPSGRARCRHLAHPDAEVTAVARRARGDVGDQRGRRGQEGRRSEDLDARATSR